MGCAWLFAHCFCINWKLHPYLKIVLKKMWRITFRKGDILPFIFHFLLLLVWTISFVAQHSWERDKALSPYEAARSSWQAVWMILSRQNVCLALRSLQQPQFCSVSMQWDLMLCSDCVSVFLSRLNCAPILRLSLFVRISDAVHLKMQSILLQFLFLIPSSFALQE